MDYLKQVQIVEEVHLQKHIKMGKKYLGINYKFWYELRVLLILVINAYTIKSTLIEIVY